MSCTSSAALAKFELCFEKRTSETSKALTILVLYTVFDYLLAGMNMNMNHVMPMSARPAAGVAPGGAPTSLAPSQRPLVALLDGRDCSVEMPILKVRA